MLPLGHLHKLFLLLAHTSFLSSSSWPWSFSILELPYYFLMEASMIFPDCSRLLSCVIAELLLLPAVQLHAVGAVTMQSVVCMTCCRLFEERDYILFFVVSPAPSTLLGTVGGREACKEQVVEERTKQTSFPYNLLWPCCGPGSRWPSCSPWETEAALELSQTNHILSMEGPPSSLGRSSFAL